jgi:hypothetical protein
MSATVAELNHFRRMVRPDDTDEADDLFWEGAAAFADALKAKDDKHDELVAALNLMIACTAAHGGLCEVFERWKIEVVPV